MASNNHILVVSAAFTFVMLLGSAAHAQQPADAVGGQNPALATEAQQNIGTAQLLFKLGQTQGQLAALQEQEATRAAYWKEYVEGINRLHPPAPSATPTPPAGSPPAPPATPPTAR